MASSSKLKPEYKAWNSRSPDVPTHPSSDPIISLARFPFKGFFCPTKQPDFYAYPRKSIVFPHYICLLSWDRIAHTNANIEQPPLKRNLATKTLVSTPPLVATQPRAFGWISTPEQWKKRHMWKRKTDGGRGCNQIYWQDIIATSNPELKRIAKEEKGKQCRKAAHTNRDIG